MAKTTFLEKLITRIERLDHKHVENYLVQLAQEKGLLESIFNSMLEGIVVTNRAQKIIFINHAAQEFLDAKDIEMEGQDLTRYLESLELEELAALIKTDWGKLIHRDIQMIHPIPRILHLNVFPLVSSGNAYLGLVLILTDVTKRKEEELDQMRSEKLQTVSLMASCIAHEIGNPLNSIDIHLQLLERDVHKLPTSSSKNLLESLKIVKSEIRRLDHTVRSFLVTARPIRPNLQGSDIAKILEETLRFMKEELVLNKITLKKSFLEKIAKVSVDEFQMKQAFSNIIKNAIEAMPHGGILKVLLTQDDEKVKIIFEDNGEGIPKEILPKIFEPYFTTKTSGSGLGLMISYRIVKDHGGKIDVTSRFGKGTTVSILLPMGMKRKMKLLPEQGGKNNEL
ncbi:MAG: PAS domain-containing protein [Chlamydiae bacterium]|nr:PAS domain-containing protein [Chlamydiota bacterium]MBI3265937.1 PAS domain-containing protein [Chlamydiota bacterium]